MRLFANNYGWTQRGFLPSKHAHSYAIFSFLFFLIRNHTACNKREKEDAFPLLQVASGKHLQGGRGSRAAPTVPESAWHQHGLGIAFQCPWHDFCCGLGREEPLKVVWLRTCGTEHPLELEPLSLHVFESSNWADFLVLMYLNDIWLWASFFGLPRCKLF